MSDDVLVFKIQRVKKDDIEGRPFGTSSFLSQKIPADGIIVRCEAPGQIPIYLRDSDIQSVLSDESFTNPESWGQE